MCVCVCLWILILWLFVASLSFLKHIPHINNSIHSLTDCVFNFICNILFPVSLLMLITFAYSFILFSSILFIFHAYTNPIAPIKCVFTGTHFVYRLFWYSTYTHTHKYTRSRSHHSERAPSPSLSLSLPAYVCVCVFVSRSLFLDCVQMLPLLMILLPPTYIQRERPVSHCVWSSLKST